MLSLEGLRAGYGPIEALREAMAWQWQMLAYGVILILCVFFLPRGIVVTVAGGGEIGSGRGWPVQEAAWLRLA